MIKYKSHEKILITGATGKVGSRFVSRILAKGYDVRILVRDTVKVSELVEPLLRKAM